MKNNKPILISGAVIYKKVNDKMKWFLVQLSDGGDWEIPKTPARRGESSVRAVIRLMGEQGGMRAKVLEEVGRNAGSTSINGKILPQRHIFYLMVQKGDNEVLGFVNFDWFDWDKAMKKLSSKKEQSMLEKAKEIAKEIQRTRKKAEEFEEEEELFPQEAAS